MKSSKIRSCLLIVSFLIICCNTQYTKECLANPYSPYITGYGGILMTDNNTYSMPYANVLVEIDAIKPNSYINLHFKGNYTIFNPNNNKNVTILAPFPINMLGIDYHTLDDLMDEAGGSYYEITPLEIPSLIFNSTIKINNTIIPYEICYFPKSYREDSYNFMFCFLCNITLPENSNLVLEYNFNTHIATPPILGSSYYAIEFIYQVGTARTWFGNITESVEFRVKGYQPDHFNCWRSGSDGAYGKNCTISNIKGGKSYLWEWNNVRIYEDYISLSYDIMMGFKDDTISFGKYFLLFTLIGIALMMTLQKFKLKIKK
ncbi:MAG: hypothetical protein ACFFCE_04480 [Promethearchaeota archaeon]